MTQKIVINTCWGGFGLSDAAMERYLTLTNQKFIKIVGKWCTEWQVVRKVPEHVESDGAVVRAVVEYDYFWDNDIERNDPVLVQVIEELGASANGAHAELKVVEIPDGVEWDIREYDGRESVEESRRSWS